MQKNSPDEQFKYDLEIDNQVSKFVEIKQKLTYFLVTASVAVIAFVVNFAVENRSYVGCYTWLLTSSSIAGLLTSGSSLLSLNLELRSYTLHLKYRYEKKTYESLGPEEQEKWDRINKFARGFVTSAFVFLFLEISLAVAFFLLVFGRLNNT
jgi:hypothetical protein